MEVLGDPPAHREPDQMRPLRPEAVEHPERVAREIPEIERAFVVVRTAVAARVPGDGMEAVAERFDLGGPVRPVAADPVQEEHQRTRPGPVEGEARRPLDEDRRKFRHLHRPDRFPAGAASGVTKEGRAPVAVR